MLSAVGLIRASRRRGFCPACRLFQTGDAPQEIAAPALIALAFVIVAALRVGLDDRVVALDGRHDHGTRFVGPIRCELGCDDGRDDVPLGDATRV